MDVLHLSGEIPLFLSYRYPPRIEVGIESMFNVGVPGQTQAEYDNLKATMRAAGPASAKIVDQMEAEGDGPDGDK
jgi:hypothetical protein